MAIIVRLVGKSFYRPEETELKETKKLHRGRLITKYCVNCVSEASFTRLGIHKQRDTLTSTRQSPFNLWLLCVRGLNYTTSLFGNITPSQARFC